VPIASPASSATTVAGRKAFESIQAALRGRSRTPIRASSPIEWLDPCEDDEEDEEDERLRPCTGLRFDDRALLDPLRDERLDDEPERFDDVPFACWRWRSVVLRSLVCRPAPDL